MTFFSAVPHDASGAAWGKDKARGAHHVVPEAPPQPLSARPTAPLRPPSRRAHEAEGTQTVMQSKPL